MMKKILWILIAWYAVYLFELSIVEPFGWFKGQNNLQKIGVWINIILLILPLIGVTIYYYAKKRRDVNYIGITRLNTGKGRVDAFQNIRDKAKTKIFVVGIGMSNISKYGKDSIVNRAKEVDVDFLMIDPDYLEQNKNFTLMLEEFLGMQKFIEIARNSFETLKQTCIVNNRITTNRRMRLRVYHTIPTASMVMIDPDSDEAECVVEFFLFRSGEKRPRFECRQIKNEDNLFDILKDRYLSLWHQSKIIVE